VNGSNNYSKGLFMRLNYLFTLIVISSTLQLSAQWGGNKFKEGDVISDSKTGTQGDYSVEYWKNGGTGTMTLGAGCDFSCEWGSVNNILFRKGVRPGSKAVIISYSADYKPQGNSYLSIYGWFQNPLVEYYIIESWGSWKPPGNSTKKGSVTTDSGTYDIYQNQRTGESIEGNKTFTQYWSVRTAKRTKGVITCGNHFNAWEKAGMTIGKFYEVSFNVEAYQSSGGTADVKVTMFTDSTTVGSVFRTPGNSVLSNNINTPSILYNILGQKIDGFSGPKIAGQHPIIFNAPDKASGVFYSFPASK
jgi:endo-1,4-beta-xylanase